MNRSLWFGKRKQKYQLSLYKLFVERKGIDVNDLISYINEFYPKGNSAAKLAHIGDNFDRFIKFVNEKTGIIFRKRPYKHRKDSYQKWYDEAMDGSLAYNNSADDF